MSWAGAMPCLPTCSVLPIQVRLQTQTAYRGIVDCVVKTYRHESVGDLLLRGFGAAGIQAVSTSFLLPRRGSALGREKTQVWGRWRLGDTLVPQGWF